MQRTKGANYEREVARLYRKLGYKNARRKLDQYQISGGLDLDNTGHWKVQCKACKKLNFIAAYNEAKSECGETDIAVLHAKIDHKGSFVLLSESDFIELVKQAES